MTILTPQMIADRAVSHFIVEMEFLKGIPRPAWAEPKPDTRTKWQKFKDRVGGKVNSWRHSLACWTTPYGFDD